MRAGLDRNEVESLAKTMEVKYTVSGPPIGGAKSGINFDPADPRKAGVLDRWYKAVTPLLKNYYGTGGDLNIDEIHEVIPITENYGLWHPQEGVLSGHFNVRENERIHQIGQLRYGVSKVLEDSAYTPDMKRKYKVADMITGYGVAESVRHYYSLFDGGVTGKRAIIQGWGNVAAAAGYYLSRMGVRIVGIIDRDGGVVNEAGFDQDTIRQLYLNRDGNRLRAEGMLSFDQLNASIWDMPADIFIPAAASRLVSKEHESLRAEVLRDMESSRLANSIDFRDATKDVVAVAKARLKGSGRKKSRSARKADTVQARTFERSTERKMLAEIKGGKPPAPVAQLRPAQGAASDNSPPPPASFPGQGGRSKPTGIDALLEAEHQRMWQ